VTAGVPTSLRCVAVGGGYPVPELRVIVNGRDITARYFRRTTKATLRQPADGGLSEEQEVATGLRLIEYRTELLADRLVLDAGDDGAVVHCSTASSMTSSPTGLDDHVTTEQSTSLHAHVYRKCEVTPNADVPLNRLFYECRDDRSCEEKSTNVKQ